MQHLAYPLLRTMGIEPGQRVAVLGGVLVLSGALFVRLAVSLNSYSGAGTPPMFGDYEAQRHWMEITYNLPVDEWYMNTSSNDLLYWGLDYPPLTAYHSWLCGAISHILNPHWVALNASRGFESYDHKLFMRYTVVLADILVYFTAVLAYVAMEVKRTGRTVIEQTPLLLSLLLQPSLILIDHGHFQYNCISLGLALWAVVFVTTDHDILGSVLYTLALNYKQMELYHALPFFFYLLGKAVRTEKPMWKVVVLGATVLATFVVCWLPFLTSQTLIFQVLHRVFPFSRGLYEDKVANVWCSISSVVKVRQLLSQSSLVKLSLGATLVSLAPSSWALVRHPQPQQFILALVSSSLSFFLFSFQVHEKSVLLAVLPSSLLSTHYPSTIAWFSLVAAFSMYPLLVRDGLALACWAVCGLFYLTFRLSPPPSKDGIHWVYRALFPLSMAGMLLLCFLSHVLTPPSHLPDLFPILISTYSCILFLIFFLLCQWLQLTSSEEEGGLRQESRTDDTVGGQVNALPEKAHVD